MNILMRNTRSGKSKFLENIKLLIFQSMHFGRKTKTILWYMVFQNQIVMFFQEDYTSKVLKRLILQLRKKFWHTIVN